MTNTQVAAIRQGDEVRDLHDNVWIARHDAIVSPLNATVARVAVMRGSHVAVLTCKRADF